MVKLAHVLKSSSFGKFQSRATAKRGPLVIFRSSSFDVRKGLTKKKLLPPSKLTIAQIKLGTGVLVAWDSDAVNGLASGVAMPGSSNLSSGLSGLFSDLNSIIGSSDISGVQRFEGLGGNGSNTFGNSSGSALGGGLVTGPGVTQPAGPPQGYHGGSGGDPAADDDGTTDDEMAGLASGSLVVGDTSDDTAGSTEGTTAGTSATATADMSGATTDSNGVITLGTIEIVSYYDNAHDLDAGASGETSLPGGVGAEGPSTGGSGEAEGDIFEAMEGGLVVLGAMVALSQPEIDEFVAAGALLGGAGGTATVIHGILGKMPPSDGLMPASDGIRPASDGLRPSDDSKGPGTPHSFSELAGTISTSGQQFAVVGESTNNKSAGWIFAHPADSQHASTASSSSEMELSLQIRNVTGGDGWVFASGMANLKLGSRHQALLAIA